MKSLRVWLLLLLALLLPVRGALAVAVPCSAPGAQAQVQAEPAGGHQHHASGSDQVRHDHASVDSKCNLCTACCCAAGLVSASWTVAQPARSSAVFPQLCVPTPSFIPDGQERPPRRI